MHFQPVPSYQCRRAGHFPLYDRLKNHSDALIFNSFLLDIIPQVEYHIIKLQYKIHITCNLHVTP